MRSFWNRASLYLFITVSLSCFLIRDWKYNDGSICDVAWISICTWKLCKVPQPNNTVGCFALDIWMWVIIVIIWVNFINLGVSAYKQQGIFYFIAVFLWARRLRSMLSWDLTLLSSTAHMLHLSDQLFQADKAQFSPSSEANIWYCCCYSALCNCLALASA